jgi:hypothetical protein
MDRRNFLKGTLVGMAAATTALVQIASPEEVTTLKALASIDPRMVIGRPGHPEHLPAWDRPEVYMKDPAGQFVSVGLLVDLKVDRQVVDISSAQDEFRRTMPGLQRITGTFVR